MRSNLLLLIVFLYFISFNSLAQDELPRTDISLNNLDGFWPVGENWKIAGDVFYDLKAAGKGKSTPGTGILVNTPGKSMDHLFTKMEHGDIELELEFMMEKGSNAGVYLQGRYEIQMFDSWGVLNPKSSDCGGIYERWDESRPEGRKGYEGHPPAVNVSKAPGLWQHYKIVFKAPRFNAKGEKIANALFVQVIHNGVTIHENVEVTGPTRAAAFEDEKPLGPLMIQGDHGSVAIRNISYKAYGTEPVMLSNLKLKAYEGKHNSLQELKNSTPVVERNIDVLAHQGSGTRDNFGGQITGTLKVPTSGEYLIRLALDWIPDDNNPSNPNGLGELIIGGNRVINIDGSVGTAKTLIQLEAGEHPLSLTYYKHFGYWYARSNDFTLSIEGPGVPLTHLNTPLRAIDPVGTIAVLAENRSVVLRGFINHKDEKKTHAVSVGEPGNLNYSYDLNSGNFLQIWRGNFLETTPMWHGRGETQLGLPLGSLIEFSGNPSLAYIKNQSEVWPSENKGYVYLGYDVDISGRPVFKYSLGSSQVKEAFIAEDGKKLTHTFNINSGQDASPLWCRVAEGSRIEKLPNGLYAVNDKQYLIELPAKVKPVIRDTGNNTKEMLIQVTPKNQEAQVRYAIVW